MAKSPASEEVVDPRKLFATDPILQLSKLSWLIVQIQERKHANFMERIYLSIDAVSNAWLLHEWLWNSATDAQRAELILQTKATRSDLDGFRVSVQRWSWSIAACRQLAIAQKHVKVGYNRDDVYFETWNDDEQEEHPCTVYIWCNGERHLDIHVYLDAMAAWACLYAAIGMPSSADVLAAIKEVMRTG